MLIRAHVEVIVYVPKATCLIYILQYGRKSCYHILWYLKHVMAEISISIFGISCFDVLLHHSTALSQTWGFSLDQSRICQV